MLMEFYEKIPRGELELTAKKEEFIGATEEQINPMSRINMQDYLDTIQYKGAGKRNKRIKEFCIKYNLTKEDYDILRMKIVKNQWVLA